MQQNALNEQSVSEPLLRAWLGENDMNRQKAMQIPALAGAINEIAETVANIPIKLYRKKKNKIEEVKNDKRLFLLNDDPGDTLDANMMKQALVRDFYLGGSGNIFVDWKGNNIDSLRFVYSEHLSVSRDADVVFKDYAIMVQGKSYFPYQFVRVLRNTHDGIIGTSIVDENSMQLSVCYNSLKFEEALVKTGGNKKGFVKSQKRLSQPSMDELKRAWNKLYSNSTENVVILNDGLEFQEASNTSVEMQLNENKKTNGEQIRAILGVPEDLGTEQGDKAYIKYCVNGFMNAFITALNRSLLLEKEKGKYFFGADTYELTKGDADKRYAAYKEAVETGWMQIDEVRDRENMEPLGLDFVKLGLQDVLYDPNTKIVYTPNTDKYSKLGGEGQGQTSNLEPEMEKNPSLLADMSMSQEETADQSQTAKVVTL